MAKLTDAERRKLKRYGLSGLDKPKHTPKGSISSSSS